MKIEIETHDGELLASLMETGETSVGSEVIIPGNARLCYIGKVERAGVMPGMTEVLQFVLTFSSGVLASMVATWLTDKMKERSETIRIGKDRLQTRENDLKARIQRCIEGSNEASNDNKEKLE